MVSLGIIRLNSVYLGLRVRSDPWKGSIPAIVGHQPVHLVSQHDGKRHHLLSLVRGIPVHYSLWRGGVAGQRSVNVPYIIM